MVCTNVPGPQLPLYLLGHKMLHCYPYVPVGGEMALNSAILTYNGTAYFGFSGDVHAAPDLRRLEALLQTSFTELQEAARGTSPRKQAQTKNSQKKDGQEKDVRNKTPKKKRAPAKAKATSARGSTPVPEPASVHASVASRPVTSIESASAPGSFVKEKNVLTQATA